LLAKAKPMRFEAQMLLCSGDKRYIVRLYKGLRKAEKNLTGSPNLCKKLSVDTLTFAINASSIGKEQRF
jgi:hypothetical protein